MSSACKLRSAASVTTVHTGQAITVCRPLLLGWQQRRRVGAPQTFTRF